MDQGGSAWSNTGRVVFLSLCWAKQCTGNREVIYLTLPIKALKMLDLCKHKALEVSMASFAPC